jgi:ceramide glucosyltransferase
MLLKEGCEGASVTDVSSLRLNSQQMIPAIWPAAAFCIFALLCHIVSVLIVARRCRASDGADASADGAPGNTPPVTLVRPVCGLDNFAEETLRSSFELDYPGYEIIFCVANAADPVVPIVTALMAANPDVPTRLIVGDERISGNPKLNNCVKGWNAARHDWIVIADSNVLMPRDYIHRLLARFETGTGLVCSPPLGSRPQNFWAGLECAFLNTYQVRWQYFADAFGYGFAQGKTMLWRRDVLENAGGIRALGAEVAEDAASTKIVRAAGLSVRLVDAPFEQPLGRRSASEVWHRQIRWARLRRACFPGYFAPEILGGALLPMIAAGIWAAAADVSIAGTLATFAFIWYGAEMMLARRAGWYHSLLYPVHGILRDLMLPMLWVGGWLGTDFVWRGNQMTIADSDEAMASAGVTD